MKHKTKFHTWIICILGLISSLGFVSANLEFSKIKMEAGNAIKGFDFIGSKNDK